MAEVGSGARGDDAHLVGVIPGELGGFRAAGQLDGALRTADATLAVGRYWWSLQWNDGSTDLALCSGPFVVKDWTL